MNLKGSCYADFAQAQLTLFATNPRSCLGRPREEWWKRIVRRVSLISVLLLTTLCGCAMPQVVARTPDSTPLIARAESDHLGDMSDAVHKDPDEDCERKHKSSSCSRCNRNPCTCKSWTDSSFFGQLFWMALSVPFVVPPTILNDDYDHYTEFPDYPYAEGVPGSLLIADESNVKKQSWTGNLQLFAVRSSDDVNRFGSRLVLDSESRFGIDAEVNDWSDTSPLSGTSHLWTGDANLVFRFAESPHFQWRTGVGFNWLADQTRPEAGINFTYGVEWFPRKPWTVSSVVDLGTLGQGTLFHNRTTVGAMLGPVEAFAGYDYFQIATARFHGPVAGLGWRF